jgi:UDP-2,4-diacetamido-2,4,6-trideoxy-beta-L-altropyranose hydrolase
MTIVFRADASLQIGSGHVMRCLTLADELRQRGADVMFVCREQPGNLIGLIESKNYRVVCLPREEALYVANFEDVVHAAWLSVSWEHDATDTIEVLGKVHPQWLVIDHYAIDYRWEKALRPHVGKIMVIDDLADRHHDCDLLLDQNLNGNIDTRYHGVTPYNCKSLLGPHYALLRPEFAMARNTLRVRSGIVRRILIFMGGCDLANETAKALEVVRQLDRPDIAVDVVIGAANPKKEEIKSLCYDLPMVSYHCQIENIYETMAEADIAIGAGGATSWERCCLGLPALIISVAHNQVEIAQNVDRYGAAVYLGPSSNVDVKRILLQLQEIIRQSDRLVGMCRNAMKLVDGQGAKRVADHILNHDVERGAA